MSELMVLLQALLLIAGWLLFVRAQTELRAQAARQSLTGELEELRQTIDALLQKLAEDAARAEARIEARLRELERYTPHAPPTEPTPPTPTALPKSVDAHALNPPSPQPSPPLSRGERVGVRRRERVGVCRRWCIWIMRRFIVRRTFVGVGSVGWRVGCVCVIYRVIVLI